MNETRVKLSKVPVSGAFHTNYMKPAQDMFSDALERVTLSLNNCGLFSNQTGDYYKSTTEIREYLVRQVCEPVQWYPILQTIANEFYAGRFSEIYEIGAGRNLKSLLSKVDRNMIKKTTCISL